VNYSTANMIPCVHIYYTVYSRSGTKYLVSGCWDWVSPFILQEFRIFAFKSLDFGIKHNQSGTNDLVRMSGLTPFIWREFRNFAFKSRDFGIKHNQSGTNDLVRMSGLTPFIWRELRNLAFKSRDFRIKLNQDSGYDSLIIVFRGKKNFNRYSEWEPGGTLR
jgi:hypothetical protein